MTFPFCILPPRNTLIPVSWISALLYETPPIIEQTSLTVTEYQPCGNFLLCPLSQGVKSGFMRFNNSMAGSSFGSCGTSLPWMARSRILLLVCLIVVCKSSFPCSIWSIRQNQSFNFWEILCCSFNGGTGTMTSLIVATDNPGCAVEVAYWFKFKYSNILIAQSILVSQYVSTTTACSVA